MTINIFQREAYVYEPLNSQDTRKISNAPGIFLRFQMSATSKAYSLGSPLFWVVKVATVIELDFKKYIEFMLTRQMVYFVMFLPAARKYNAISGRKRVQFRSPIRKSSLAKKLGQVYDIFAFTVKIWLNMASESVSVLFVCLGNIVRKFAFHPKV